MAKTLCGLPTLVTLGTLGGLNDVFMCSQIMNRLPPNKVFYADVLGRRGFEISPRDVHSR